MYMVNLDANDLNASLSQQFFHVIRIKLKKKVYLQFLIIFFVFLDLAGSDFTTKC